MMTKYHLEESLKQLRGIWLATNDEKVRKKVDELEKELYRILDMKYPKTKQKHDQNQG